MVFAAEYLGVPHELDDIVPLEYKIRADAFLQRNNLAISRKNARAIFVALCNM